MTAPLMNTTSGNSPTAWLKEKRCGKPSARNDQFSHGQSVLVVQHVQQCRFFNYSPSAIPIGWIKTFDIHAHPLNIRDEVKKDLGDFPFPHFGDPEPDWPQVNGFLNQPSGWRNGSLPDLSLVYLPHLDYDLQKMDPNSPQAEQAIQGNRRFGGRLTLLYEISRYKSNYTLGIWTYPGKTSELSQSSLTQNGLVEYKK